MVFVVVVVSISQERQDFGRPYAKFCMTQFVNNDSSFV